MRGVGRLENPELIPLIPPLLFSDGETVRSEAVNALGQAVFRTDGDKVAEGDVIVRATLVVPVVE